MKIVDKNGLKISSILFEFINNEVIPGTEVSTDKFWNSFAKAVADLAPINKDLIKKERIYKEKLMIGINQTLIKILIKRSILNF